MTALMFVLSGLLVMLDQWTKHLAVQYLCGQPAIELWPGVFELHFLEQGNDGVAWGLFSGQMWLIIPLTCATMLLIAVMLVRSDLRHSRWFSLSLSLILGGGVGNLIDRVAHGSVVDFLYFKLIDFPIFNVADCFVVIGAIGLFAYLLFGCKDTDIASLRGLVLGSPSAGKEMSHDRVDMDCSGRTGE